MSCSSRSRVSQVPRLISSHAPSPSTPGGSLSAFAHCFLNDLRLQHLREIGHLHWRNEAVSSSLALRLARSPCEASCTPLLLHTLAWLPVKRAITGLGPFTQPDQPGLAWRTEDAKRRRRTKIRSKLGRTPKLPCSLLRLFASSRETSSSSSSYCDPTSLKSVIR